MSEKHIMDNPPNKSAIVLLIIFFLILAMGLAYRLYEQILTLEVLEKPPIIFKWDSGLAPFIFLAPAYFTLLSIFVKRIKGTATEKDSNNTIKVIIINFPVFLAAHWLLSTYQSNWLQDKGYQKCPWYTGSTIGAPVVWVQDSKYCFKKGFMVRTDLVDWATQIALTNQEVTPKNVIDKIYDLIEKR